MTPMTLFLVFGAVMVASALSNQNGLCRNREGNECNEYCEKKFGKKLIESKCKEESKNKRQCICKFKREEADEFSIDDEDDSGSDEGHHSRNHPKGKPHRQGRPDHDRHGNGNGDGGHGGHGGRGGRGGSGGYRSSCPDFVPLFRFWERAKGYLILVHDMRYIMTLRQQGWISSNQYGFGATRPDVCPGKTLKPIYYLQKGETNQAGSDFIYTNNHGDIAQLKNSGYKGGDVHIYCSGTPDADCGATFPVYRYKQTAGEYAGHYYYGSDDNIKVVFGQGAMAQSEVLCYTWPNIVAGQ